MSSFISLYFSIDIYPTEIKTLVNSSIVLTCNVTNPLYNSSLIAFRRDDEQRLIDQKYVHILDDQRAQLIIHNVQASQTGRYYCILRVRENFKPFVCVSEVFIGCM